MKNFSFFFACLMVITMDSFAQTKTDSIETVAREYMKAYSNWDFEKMKSFYSDGVHFEDPTATEAFGQPYVFDGKEKVHGFFNNVFKDRFKNDRPPYVKFNMERVFSTGSLVIISSTFECIVPTSWYKEKSDEALLISIPFVTILEVKNGQITKHFDYGDYKKYNAQIRAQLNK